MYTYLRADGKARAHRPTVRGNKGTVPVHISKRGKQRDLGGVRVPLLAFFSCRWTAVVEQRTAQAHCSFWFAYNTGAILL